MDRMVIKPAAVCSEKEDNERMQKAASTFHPTLWGDFFVDYQPPNKSQCLNEQKNHKYGINKKTIPDLQFQF
uniref:Uncharacterized protein n=1 Tax=Oryza sativa subsp. japonica TaxID=39947 RepID=Q6ZCP1_ORYSJ|nr:hypothetical protein [Oryza sativa Japonica Group]